MVNCLEANLNPLKKLISDSQIEEFIRRGMHFFQEWMHFQPSNYFQQLVVCTFNQELLYTSWTCFEHSFGEVPSNRNSSCSAFEVCGSIFLGIKTFRWERKRCCFHYALANTAFQKSTWPHFACNQTQPSISNHSPSIAEISSRKQHFVVCFCGEKLGCKIWQARKFV